MNTDTWTYDKHPTGAGGYSHAVYDETAMANPIADVAFAAGKGEAHARLIAAAPAMLEALRILLVQCGDPARANTALYHAMNIAAAAIATATRDC